MKIEINKDDIIKGNIELSRTLVTEALLYSQEEIRAKKLFLAYKSIENILRMLGVDLQDKEN